MPAKQKVSEDQILTALKKGFTWAEMHKYAGISRSGGMYDRVQRVAAKHGLEVPKHYANRVASGEDKRKADEWDAKLRAHSRKHFSLQNGFAIIGSDAHWWPGRISTGTLAFNHFCRELKPSVVVLNGDGFDGASISRWPRIGWDRKPTVQDELTVVKQRLDEIEASAGTKNLFWPLGNHDGRLEGFLAAKAPEFEGVHNFRLKDHVPMWTPCWSLWINDDVVVKHRFKGGVGATRLNAIYSGKSIITGHLHSLKVTPHTDYNGTRYGVDCGTLAEVDGPQFVDYTEDSPKDWRAGFSVLTFWNGRLLPPETVEVIDEQKRLVVFRGKVVEV